MKFIKLSLIILFTASASATYTVSIAEAGIVEKAIKLTKKIISSNKTKKPSVKTSSRDGPNVLNQTGVVGASRSAKCIANKYDATSSGNDFCHSKKVNNRAGKARKKSAQKMIEQYLKEPK